MNICISLWFRAPLGGLQENVRATVLFLLEQEVGVTVICPPGIFARQLRAAGADVVETAFEDPDAVVAQLSDRSFDLVHAHPGPSRVLGLKLSRDRGIPFFVTYHGAWVDKVGSYWQHADVLFGVSKAVIRRILRQAPDAADRVHLMPNTTNLPDMAPQEQRARDSWHIVVPSRFDVDKAELISLLQGLWDLHGRAGPGSAGLPLHWHLAGTGTQLLQLREAAQRLEQRIGRACVTFHGWLSQDDLQALYRSCDFAAAPGRSALDALSFGLPTIAVGSAGCFGLVNSKTYLDAAFANFGGHGLTTSRTPAYVFDALVRMMDRPETFAQDRADLRRMIKKHHHAALWNKRLITRYRLKLEARQ